MADQEVIKHTRKVLEIMAHKEHTILAKLREIGLEVAIIVFAVSTSIWLHGVSEHRHDQEKVKMFLLGLKNDLHTNTASLKQETEIVRQRTAEFAYLAALDPGAPVERARFERALDTVSYPRFGVFLQSGRYESFKSSGRLMSIEDEKLLQKIVFEFETGIQAIHGGESLTKAAYLEFRNYMNEGGDAGTDPFKLITAPKGKRLCRAMANTMINDYLAMMERNAWIERDIDAMFPGQSAKAD